MFADERRTHIEQMLKKHSAVTTSELTRLFQVSLETIRRDLEYLEDQGVLKRVHGGAISVAKQQKYTDFTKRTEWRQSEKRNLAMTACSFIQEGNEIALDAGSTTLELAALLCERFRELTVLTHSLEAVGIFSEQSRFRTILAGGFYLPQERCFYGHLTLDMIRQIHVSKCFIAPSAISLDFGVSDHIPELISVQRALLKSADQAYLLVDSSKFETFAPLKICDIDSRYVCITDSGLSDELLETYQKASVNIIKK